MTTYTTFGGEEVAVPTTSTDAALRVLRNERAAVKEQLDYDLEQLARLEARMAEQALTRDQLEKEIRELDAAIERLG